MANRPDMSEVSSAQEFLSWYWLKEELITYCKVAGIPSSGSKQQLLDRIAYALEHDGKIPPLPSEPKPTSSVNWARETLSPDTVLTDSVTFGPNFRRYFSERIGKKFVCHSDFMDWVKAHPGKTLAEAEKAWQQLEDRKLDPTFQRSIARQNMMAQYIRDYLEAFPDHTFKEAVKVWQWKKTMPMKQERVLFEKSDIMEAKKFSSGWN